MDRTQGSEKLAKWLEDERRTQHWLAEQIGAHQTSVSRWLLGKSPTIEMAVKLEALTGIEVSSWVPTPDSTTNLIGDPNDVDAAALHTRPA